MVFQAQGGLLNPNFTHPGLARWLLDFLQDIVKSRVFLAHCTPIQVRNGPVGPTSAVSDILPISAPPELRQDHPMFCRYLWFPDAKVEDFSVVGDYYVSPLTATCLPYLHILHVHLSSPLWCHLGTSYSLCYSGMRLTMSSVKSFLQRLILNELITLFIIMIICKNKLVWIMMSSMFYLFSLQILEISDLEVLNVWLFLGLFLL